MKLLDLFCCAGGAAMGYHRAGFAEIVGVDIVDRPNYPFTFVQADAIEYLDMLIEHGHDFDAATASAPCQAYSATNALTAARNKTRVRPLPPKLIEPTRERLLQLGIPFVLENVEGAPLRKDLVLCGSMFPGLRVRRHRVFELHGFECAQPACDHAGQKARAEAAGKTIIGVYGDHPDPPRPYRTNCAGSGQEGVENARDAMGMPWASWLEMCEAIPPAYTEYIGRHMIASLESKIGRYAL